MYLMKSCGGRSGTDYTAGISVFIQRLRLSCNFKQDDGSRGRFRSERIQTCPPNQYLFRTGCQTWNKSGLCCNTRSVYYLRKMWTSSAGQNEDGGRVRHQGRHLHLLLTLSRPSSMFTPALTVKSPSSPGFTLLSPSILFIVPFTPFFVLFLDRPCLKK